MPTLRHSGESDPFNVPPASSRCAELALALLHRVCSYWIYELNAVVFFRDFFAGRYPVQRSDFHPVSKGADIDDRLNYINGAPYPRKPAKAKKGKARKKGEG